MDLDSDDESDYAWKINDMEQAIKNIYYHVLSTVSACAKYNVSRYVVPYMLRDVSKLISILKKISF